MNIVLRDAILAYFHYLFIIATAAVLAMEAVLCRPGLGPLGIRRLALVDLGYLFVAMGTVASGLFRIWYGVKGSSYYFTTHIVYVKLGLFGLIGLISIVPTLRFLRWRKNQRQTPEILPKDGEVVTTARIVYLELLLLATLPLLGALMARGYGF